MLDSELTRYLRKIQTLFEIDSLVNQQIGFQDTVDYYLQSSHGYRVFHSREGSIHMALNYDERFDRSGYYGQAKLVQERIGSLHSGTVLELGSGKGFNSIFLAHHNPHLLLTGLDITPRHVAIAKHKGRAMGNLFFSIANFEHICFGSEVFDLVFEVESICHAMDMAQVLSEVFRVVKPLGHFIVFDGFRKRKLEYYPRDVQIAARLVEKTMAASSPWVIHEWLELANSIGFDILETEDLSEAIMPNLMRFQFLARVYFKFPILSRCLLHIFPEPLVKNAIAGLLMPLTVKAQAHGYYKVVLMRP